ncbi:morphogenetic protein [Escherichia coli]|nr:morphogenetic protein [Escherichia coli]EKG7113540.1 morphogenetic protein [Escherichia coli]ELM8776639.1 morphogenetic protein [Escherichia coli]EMA4402930.1 morphogenetic protein [Escherichia coli]HAH8500999.1 morphogenetic protein [Escherichia coli]
MPIAEYIRPSRPSESIHFRKPTVADSIRFCDISPAFEERITTEYLNALQTGTVSDSRKWTAADRRTALWWIYIFSKDDPTITASYECSHCGEIHYYDCDMRTLDSETVVLDRPSSIDVTLRSDGEKYEWQIVPLDGQAMENLEIMRGRLPEDRNSKEWVQAITQLRLWEMVYQTRLFYDLDTDYDAAANRRYDLINRMHISGEFPLLVARIKQAQDVMKHGINIQIIDGAASVLLPPHECPNGKDAEGWGRTYTRLLLDFRNRYFIPDSGFNWLADFSQQPDFVWEPAGE